jgi:hypothetical protein
VDVIFHKCKPQGGRRLTYGTYMQALGAAADETNMNVIELCALLAEQITPSPNFVAPQPVMFRQETRTMGQSKFKVPVEETPPPPSADNSVGEVLMLGRGKKGDKKDKKERVLELSESEDEERESVSGLLCIAQPWQAFKRIAQQISASQQRRAHIYVLSMLRVRGSYQASIAYNRHRRCNAQ